MAGSWESQPTVQGTPARRNAASRASPGLPRRPRRLRSRAFRGGKPRGRGVGGHPPPGGPHGLPYGLGREPPGRPSFDGNTSAVPRGCRDGNASIARLVHEVVGTADGHLAALRRAVVRGCRESNEPLRRHEPSRSGEEVRLLPAAAAASAYSATEPAPWPEYTQWQWVLTSSIGLLTSSELFGRGGPGSLRLQARQRALHRRLGLRRPRPEGPLDGARRTGCHLAPLRAVLALSALLNNPI